MKIVALVLTLCILGYANANLSAGATTSISGYYNVNKTTDANLFYWFFEAQTNPTTAPFIIWLTGGPGCSSELAIFYENGPFSLSEDMQLVNNPYSWNKVANMLYVDSPVGTGFSYVSDPNGYSTNEEEVAANLYSMLSQFMADHPQYAQLPFYVFGESYAGHYVPALSYFIYTKNQDPYSVHFNLKGLAVGNAMVYPAIQYGSMGPMAYSHGLIGPLALKETEGLVGSCVDAINSGSYNDSNTICNEIMNVIQENAGPFNPYDVRKTCPPSLPLCYNFTLVGDYLAQPSVRQQLGVPTNVNWTLCSNVVYADIINDWWNTEVAHIPILLEAGIRTLVYNGNMGWICNYLGSEAWVSQLEWSNNQQWNNAPRKIVMTGQNIGGYTQSYGGLTLMAVNNAGHMVPMDQPETSLNMVISFLNNKF
ncbi:hypothetical protein SAMD00019534_108440 [Acytostelium subglobosum LB1]|uniref:hypothetical protein n=1 Tax=Acytostelium subglobosum LB1 TaxID=1410327 RepID=UPI000644F295|nr:hypothetical protein SAMD00019534_108440 [Acytostelium subglobosum LB1]GAM27668.1 hypothetical protein SAMD00019534_108440 [Acytostelium subglobosum LB1]|eukprot:XP_012749327.1 hypothetical protein SAMD00019534_108440 [Acytostelium subglobosum LB1]